jgi:hypothetical protein
MASPTYAEHSMLEAGGKARGFGQLHQHAEPRILCEERQVVGLPGKLYKHLHSGEGGYVCVLGGRRAKHEGAQSLTSHVTTCACTGLSASDLDSDLSNGGVRVRRCDAVT